MDAIKLDNDLISAIKKNELVIFIGSGLSKNLEMPDWKSLIYGILDELSDNDEKYNMLRGPLEHNIFSEIFTLDKIIEMDSSNKGKIYRALENAIDKDLSKYDFNTHKLIGELSSMIITTNYDRAIETALPTFKKIVDDTYRIGSFTDYDKYIFKIHGCIDSPTNCVLFTEDYKKIYEGSTKFERLKSIVTDKTILFIGFSFQDQYIKETFKYIQSIYTGFSKRHFIVTTDERNFDEYGLYPIKIENWGNLSSLLDYLISLKNNNNSLEMNLKIEEINSVPSVQVNKKIRIAILYSNPIDVEHYYNVDLIIKHFKRFNIDIEYKHLSEESLNDLEEIDYIFIFTKVLQNKIVIEDKYFKRKLYSLNQLEDQIYLPESKGIFIFVDDNGENLEKDDISLPIAVIKFEENLNTFLFKLLKKASLDSLDFSIILNKEKFNLLSIEKGDALIVNSIKSPLSEKIERKNLTNFVGRKTDLLDTIRKIKDSQDEIITVKGSGGIGKTTLIKKIALEFHERENFKDGIGFVDCEHIKDYETLEKNIARNFNLENSVNFYEHMKTNQTKLDSLIILDNFESILSLDEIDKMKKLVIFISNYSTIVVTSRQWIGFDFEEKHELRGFTTEEAFTLFQKYYSSKIDDEDIKFLKEEILEKLLNNNPLAIKIITKNLPKSMNLKSLRDELKTNFFTATNTDYIDIYENEIDENIERSESLYQSIYYSYVRLNNKEQLIFDILSLFPNGIHMEFFKKFFSSEDNKMDIYRITNKEIKGLEDKSLIEINGGYITLQSIIGRFADFKLNRRTESEKLRYYIRAFKFNLFQLELIDEIGMDNKVKALRIFDLVEENFIKSFEYIEKIEYSKTISEYLILLSEWFYGIGKPKKYALNIIKCNNIFNKENNGEILKEVLFHSAMYYNGEFKDSLDYVLDHIGFEKLKTFISDSSTFIERTIVTDVLSIYSHEGYEYEVLHFLYENKLLKPHYFDIFFKLGVYNFYDLNNVVKDFFYFETKYNLGEINIDELNDYLDKGVYKKEYIEIVQTNYIKTKMGFNIKEEIDKLIVSNPFTMGLKDLMLAKVEEKIEIKKDLFENSIKKLFHIKYYYLEAIYYYCDFLQRLNLNEFDYWYKLGNDLAIKYKYNHLIYKFNSLVQNEIEPYNQDQYIGNLGMDLNQIKKEMLDNKLVSV